MPKHFLKMWLYRTVQYNFDVDSYLGHSASDQYKRVTIGDHVWFVTVPPKSEQIILFGHMVIGWIGDQDEAAERLDTKPDELWEAQYHIIPEEDRVEPFDYIDITPYADQLTFQSRTGRNRLPVTRRAQALQTMRVLTPQSVSLLREIWYTTGDNYILHDEGKNIPEVFKEGHRKLQTHYRLERNKAVVAAAKRHFGDVNGRLYCEVCGFDFSQQYGELGDDFIEAHHKRPLYEIGGSDHQTSIDDLAMVCANCHRMLHRRKPPLTIEALKQELSQDSSSETM